MPHRPSARPDSPLPHPPGPPPDRAALHEAAVTHLARFAAAEAGLRRVLARRLARWRQAAVASGMDPEAAEAALVPARDAAAAVVAALLRVGAVDDRAYAGARARGLRRAGRSRRAVAAHLLQRGIAADLVAETLPDDPAGELLSALRHARRRRVGPFAPGGGEETPADAGTMRRMLARMGRAGFGGEVARRALAMDRAGAEALLRDAED